MTEKKLPTYLSLDEAAEVMSLSVKTIRRRISDGTIPAYQCGRRPIRIRLDDLENAMQRVPASGRLHRAGSTDAIPAPRG